MDVRFSISRQRPGVTGGKYPADCPTRVLLSHITSRWGVLVLLALDEGPKRWGELHREIEGISEKMLASTLRTFEADGLVHREVGEVVPPRVDYSLTDRGAEITRRLLPVMDWIHDEVGVIASA